MTRQRMTKPAAVAVAAAICVGIGPALGDDVQDGKEAPTRNVAIVVHQGVELLDFAGPGEVFAAAANQGAQRGHPWFRVYTVAPSEGPVVSQGFVTIQPAYTIQDCPAPDILVIPGGGTGVLTGDQAFMSWVRSITPDTEICFSVCTGALVLAKAGRLDGLEATTHWGAISALKQAAPGATVLENRRFLDNGRVITTAGVSAGIDGALHLVARLLGLNAARQTARYMEYQWDPDPETLKGYPDFNPQLGEAGRMRQKAVLYRTERQWDKAAAAYQVLVELEPDDAEAWYALGLSLHAAGRYREAIDAHKKAATFPQERQRPLYNLACAYALTGATDKALETLAEAIAAGFDDGEWIQQDADFDGIRNDPRFIELVGKMQESQKP